MITVQVTVWLLGRKPFILVLHTVAKSEERAILLHRRAVIRTNVIRRKVVTAHGQRMICLSLSFSLGPIFLFNWKGSEAFGRITFGRQDFGRHIWSTHSRYKKPTISCRSNNGVIGVSNKCKVVQWMCLSNAESSKCLSAKCFSTKRRWTVG